MIATSCIHGAPKRARFRVVRLDRTLKRLHRRTVSFRKGKNVWTVFGCFSSAASNPRSAFNHFCRTPGHCSGLQVQAVNSTNRKTWTHSDFFPKKIKTKITWFLWHSAGNGVAVFDHPRPGLQTPLKMHNIPSCFRHRTSHSQNPFRKSKVLQRNSKTVNNLDRHRWDQTES